MNQQGREVIDLFQSQGVCAKRRHVIRKPMAIALINFTIATSRAEEVQIGESCPSKVIVGRKGVLAQALGGQERKACSKV